MQELVEAFSAVHTTDFRRAVSWARRRPPVATRRTGAALFLARPCGTPGAWPEPEIRDAALADLVPRLRLLWPARRGGGRGGGRCGSSHLRGEVIALLVPHPRLSVP